MAGTAGPRYLPAVAVSMRRGTSASSSGVAGVLPPSAPPFRQLYRWPLRWNSRPNPLRMPVA